MTVLHIFQNRTHEDRNTEASNTDLFLKMQAPSMKTKASPSGESLTWNQHPASES